MAGHSVCPWRDTFSALDLYTRIIGKYLLARTPWVNHSWHATQYPNARGFTTGLVPDALLSSFGGRRR
ncbi:DUF5996 family protein [Mesorhizobium escarrei]|uniref:DUF5996 family protein n=1 Tax=Mesorhizobium escarrei TaxID=666018 RepID=UPI00345C2509